MLKKNLKNLVAEGGSIARSTALHAACQKNNIEVVKLLLDIDADSSNMKDKVGQTPLMAAAINATGRFTINGIDDTTVIDLLLDSGSSKAEVDSIGMTAYGHFKQKSEMFVQMALYDCRHKITDLEHKLYPPGGPSVIDFADGTGGTSGLVDYGPEDTEFDRMLAGYQ